MGSEVEPGGGGEVQAPPTAAQPPPEGLPEAEGVVEEARVGQSAQGRAANAVAVALSRAARSFLLYDSGNAAIRAFLESLRNAAMHYVSAHGDLPLEVRPFEMAVNGEVIYVERDRERSMAFRLYRDGVRKLTLKSTMNWHELLKLLEVLSIRYTGIRQAEDDMVVLLWKAGFQSIDVEAVEGFVADEEVEDRPPPTGEELQIGGAPPNFDLPIARPPNLFAVRYVEPDPAALATIVAEDESHALPDIVVRVAEELVAMASDRGDPLTFSEALPQLREIRDFLMNENLLDHVTRVAYMLARVELATPEDDRMAGEFLASFVNEEGLGRFLHGVSRDSVEAPPEMVALLDALPGNHLHTLVLLMGSERAEHSRRVARSLVERYVPHHGDWIVSKLAGAESAVAVELLRALRMADPDRALTGVQEVATRLEPELQIECLATLDAQVTGPVVSRVLLGYVESPHEEPRVQALEQVGRRQIALAYAQLVPLCKRRVGLGMSTAERDGWGWALVRCDRAQAMVDFRDWIRPRGFFRSALPGQETLQWIAVSGLAHVPGPEAEQLIRTAAEVGGSELEKHCVQTMVRRRRTARAGTR